MLIGQKVKEAHDGIATWEYFIIKNKGSRHGSHYHTISCDVNLQQDSFDVRELNYYIDKDITRVIGEFNGKD